MVRKRKQLSVEAFFANNSENAPSNSHKKAKEVNPSNLGDENQKLDEFYRNEEIIDANDVETSSFLRFYPDCTSTLSYDLQAKDKNWLYLCDSPGEIIRTYKEYVLTALKLSAIVYDFTSLPIREKALDSVIIDQGCTLQQPKRLLPITNLTLILFPWRLKNIDLGPTRVSSQIFLNFVDISKLTQS